MTTDFEVERSSRVSPATAFDGVNDTFGPFGFQVFDTADVIVEIRDIGSSLWLQDPAATFTKGSAELDTFTVQFAEIYPATKEYRVRGKRIHERKIALKYGNILSLQALSRVHAELAHVVQELRRDVDVVGLEDAAALIGQAEGYAATASTRAGEASNSAGTASEAASTATAARDKAQAWAEAAEDTEVEAGQFSAKHWAAKAAEDASSTAANISYDNQASGLTAATVQDAVDELDAAVDGFQGVPSGTVAAFASSTPPTDWLECDGSAISRTTYAALFTAIGTTFGAGDGSTTFNIPDLRGEFIRGFDNGRGVDSGRVIGSSQLDADQLLTGHWRHGGGSRTDYGWNATGPFYITGANAGYGAYGREGSPRSIYTYFDNSRVIRTAAETRPRNVALMYVIKY